MNAGRRFLCLGAAALGSLLTAPRASAQEEPFSATDTASHELQGSGVWALAPRFDQAPGWSIGIDAYAGIAVLSTADGGVAHGVVGGISRFQLGYLQLGGLLESSDGGENQWRSLGAFAGAFIPFRHWVDFEFAAGVAARTYRDPRKRYGPDGYEATSPALLFRAGVSDRAVDGLFGLRLGGHIAAAIDLERHVRPWQYTIETPDGDVRTITGSSKVGGFSVALAVTAGFDIGRKPRVPVERKTASR